MFHTVMRFFSFLCTFLGLSNFVITERPTESRKVKVFRKLLSFVILILFTKPGFHYVFMFRMQASRTSVYLNKIIILLEIFNAIYFIIVSNIGRFQMGHFIKELDECERDISKLFPKNRFQIFEIKKRSNLIILINAIGFLGVVASFYGWSNDSNVPKQTNNGALLLMIIFYIVTVTFALCGNEMWYIFKRTNNFVQNIIKLKDEFEADDAATVENLENFFVKIFVLSERLDDHFQKHFLGCIMYCFLEPLWGLYYLIINYTQKTTITKSAHIYWCAIQIFHINEWIWVLNLLRNETLQLNNNFFTLALTFPGTLLSEMATSLVITNTKSTNKIFGSFPVDWTLNTWMLSTIFSYLIIVLQFRSQEDPEKSSLTF